MKNLYQDYGAAMNLTYIASMKNLYWAQGDNMKLYEHIFKSPYYDSFINWNIHLNANDTFNDYMCEWRKGTHTCHILWFFNTLNSHIQTVHWKYTWKACMENTYWNQSIMNISLWYSIDIQIWDVLIYGDGIGCDGWWWLPLKAMP